MTRLATDSSQIFDINTRTIHKSIFSCTLWWFVGVCNIVVGHIDLQQVGFDVFSSLFSFCLLVSDKFGQK